MSKHNYRYQKPIKPIEIKEPFKPEVITFENPSEFTEYYRQNEDEFRDMTTYKLNVKYKIPGYRITQSKKKDSETELKLIKDYRSKQPEELNDITNKLNDINIRMEEIEAKIHYIESFLEQFSVN